MAKAKIMKFEELPDQLSAQHIADYLGKSRRWVYEMMKISPEVGGIPSYTLPSIVGTGKCLHKRVSKIDFGEWLQTLKSQQKGNVINVDVTKWRRA